MRKVIIRPNLDFKLTKEQEKERDEAWEALCNNGSICITDPMESTEELIQESRKGIHGKQPCIYLDDFFDGTDPRLRMAMADTREFGLPAGRPLICCIIGRFLLQEARKPR